MIIIVQIRRDEKVIFEYAHQGTDSQEVEWAAKKTVYALGYKYNNSRQIIPLRNDIFLWLYNAYSNEY